VDLDDLKNLQAFLNRVQLQGSEVPVWSKCWNALAIEIGRRSEPPPPPPPPS
jgi:hypothetical protein